MHILSNWEDRSTAIPMEKRKRASREEPRDKDPRKRSKPVDDDSRDDYSSREAATSHAANSIESRRDFQGSALSPSSPHNRVSPGHRDSLHSPPIHPDCQQNISNGIDNPPSPHHTRVFPLSPVSRSPEQDPDEPPPDETRSASKSRFSTSRWTGNPDPPPDEIRQPKPLRVDTARSMSDLDPRSPAYTPHAMAPEAGNNDRSRRQSEIMPPPGAGTKAARSESSTPKNSTPVQVRESVMPLTMNPKSAPSASSTPLITTPGVGTSLAMTTPLDRKDISDLPCNFSNFANSITSATTVNVKVENAKLRTINNEREIRRHQKHGFLYNSVMDLTTQREAANEKSQSKLQKQLDLQTSGQEIIAAKLSNEVTDKSKPSDESERHKDNTNILDELSSIRTDLKEAQEELRNWRRKGIRQSDFDRYTKKAVNHEDLLKLSKETASHDDLLRLSKETASHDDLLRLRQEVVNRDDLARMRNEAVNHNDLLQFVTKQDLIPFVSRSDLSSFASKQELDKLSKSISDLSAITGDRSRAAQEMQQQNHARFDGLGTDMSDFKTKLESIEHDLLPLKEESVSLKTSISKIEDILTQVKDVMNTLPSLNKRIEDSSEGVANVRQSNQKLSIKIEKLEEGAMQRASAAPPLQEASLNSNEIIDLFRAELKTLRQDQENEKDALADDMEKLRHGLDEKIGHLTSRIDEQRPPGPIPQAAQPSSQAPPAPVAMDDDSRKKVLTMEDTLEALRIDFVDQKQKFERLSTEDLAKSIIHQTKQLYKEHPGHVQDELKIIHSRQANVDNYLQTLDPRIQALTTRASSDAVLPFTNKLQSLEAEAKEATNQSLEARTKVDEGMKAIKDAIDSHNLSQGPRVVEAINDLGRKFNGILDDINPRIGRLEEDQHVVNQEIYLAANGDVERQSVLRETLNYTRGIQLVENSRREYRAKKVNTAEHNGTHESVTSLSSNRRESIMSPSVEKHPHSDDDTTSTPSFQQRKKRRHERPDVCDFPDSDEVDPSKTPTN